MTDLSAAERLDSDLSGPLLRPGNAGYDEARALHNGMIDRRPDLIARCRDADDVVAAVRTARDHGLQVGVRGGGHNVAGRSVPDGGLMIDLSRMKRIEVDPEAGTVEAGPGLSWGELNEATQAHGLAVTGGVVSTTGIAGLTLGGGLGWLMARDGLALDNLRSVEIVTADGEVRTSSEEEEPDLFWAVRGAGANFGVVTRFEYDLRPVGPTVLGGILAHPVDAAPDLLPFVRDFNETLPDEMTVFTVLTHAPDGSGAPISAVALCHSGPVEEAEEAVRPLRAFGEPLMDMVGPMPYAEVNAMLDDAYPKGALYYWKSTFLEELSDGAVDALVERFAACPTAYSDLLLEHVHGAATRVAPEATAFPHRREGYNLLALGQWRDPSDGDACIAWTRESYEAMQPYARDARYVNYLDDDEPDDASALAYGTNLPRLRKLKAQYDPDNFFDGNQNIPPATGAAPAS